MENMGGAICGGVISLSMHKTLIKKYGVWADTMSFIMPDNRYRQFVSYKRQDKEKEAKKLFDKYAVSQI